ncbi:MAG: hypothetical protein PVJ33_09570 [Lysobacterales bacterium]
MDSSAVSGQQDVYAEPRGSNSGGELPDAIVTVRLERSPTALSRAFALMCTLGLVPTSASSALDGDEAIRLDLHFVAAPAGRIDLLRRKLAQLIECLEVVLPEAAAPRAEAASGTG